MQGGSSLSLETIHHRFCHLLPAKASHQACPDPRGRESDSPSLVQSAVTWQEMHIRGRRKNWCRQPQVLFPLQRKHEFGILGVPLSLCSLLLTFLFWVLIAYIVFPTLRGDRWYALNHLPLASTVQAKDSDKDISIYPGTSGT